MRFTLAIACIVLFAAPAWAHRRAAVVREVSPTALRVDGDLTDWNPGQFAVSPEQQIDEQCTLESGRSTGRADHEARFYVAAAGDTLYVAAIVTDDAVVDTHRGGEIWRGDLFEVLLSNGTHVGVAPNGDAHVFKQPNTATSVRVVAAAAKIAPGYVVELAITSKGLHAMSRINFAIKDVDPDDKEPAHRTWSGVRHNLLPSFGDLVFQPAASRAAGRACEGKRRPKVTVTTPLVLDGKRLMASSVPVTLRMVNFQSAAPNWADMWTQWDPKRLSVDLDRAVALRANAIRIFIFFETFGSATPTPEMLSRLRWLVDAAAARGLLTVPTFFADKKEFARDRYNEMETQLVNTVSEFIGHPGIAMWDLMNEPDHAFALPGAKFTAQQVHAWAEHMVRAVHAADPTHLVTLGLAGHFALRESAPPAEELLPMVDVLSMHWYFDQPLATGLARARKATDKPIVLQEIGVTSLYVDDGRASLKEWCRVAQAHELSGIAYWELYDHPVGSRTTLTPRYTQTEESDFGLLYANGDKKPIAEAFCTCLDDVPAFAITPREKP